MPHALNTRSGQPVERRQGQVSQETVKNTQRNLIVILFISQGMRRLGQNHKGKHWCLQTLNRYSINTNGTGKKREKHTTKIAVQWLRLNRKQ